MRRTCLFGLLGGLTAGVMLTGCLEDPRQPVSKGSSKSGSAATGEPTTASRSGPLGEQGEPVFDQGPVGVAVPEFGSVAASSILPSTLAPLAAGQAEDPVDDSYIPSDDPFSRADAEVRDRYDRALMDALALMADRRFEDALAGFRAAQQIRDTREVRRQIGRVQILVAREAAAQSTLADIEAVLEGGRAEEASALAAKALEEFGDSTLAPRFAEVKRRADAISGARLNTDAERRERFRNEGEAALRDRNFRAAILAFEQVLAYGDDARVRENLDELRQDLAAYDDNVRRASELRRDPWSLEDAVASLELARRAWDTEQVRLDLDELKLAIDNRRDRVAIADFETVGQTGVAGAGRLVADELVPHIRGRFDVLDRARLSEVMGDLQLASADLTDIERNGAEVARAAKFRYLIHGPVGRLSGLVVHARMVDVRSGLVVQTARATARSGDDLLRVIPQLAADLISTDQEHLARAQSDSESAVAPAAAEPVPFEDNATGIPLPPPPPPPEQGEPAPAPIQFETPKPPPDGGLRAEDFNRLPPPPAPDEAPPPPPPAMADEGPVKAKFFDVLIGLADNLFSRGDIQGAMQQYLIADQLFPGNDGVQARLDRCRPLLPPPDPVIVVPVQRPRLAIMHFVVRGDPRVVPPGLSAWTPDLLAPYYSQQFDIVDRNRVSWWMYRTGITQRQLLTDPGARRWLGRAMGTRWFLLGTVDQTNSFNVGVHLIDAEFGWVRGSSLAHCRDVWDLKLAAGELARRTLFTHDQRRNWMLNREAYNREIEQGRQFTTARRWREASDAFARAQTIRPDSEEARELKRHADSMIFADSRRGGWDRDWEDRRRDDDDSKRRRWDLARKAEQTRVKTWEDSRPVDWTRDPAGEAAYRQLMTQGRSAMTQRRFDQAIRNYESALGFRNTDEAHNALAEAKARLNEDLRLRQADEDSRRLADQQRMRDESLARAKAEFDRKRRERDEERARLADLQRLSDRKRYDDLIAEADRLDDLGRYDSALSALQAAKALGVGDAEELDRKVRRVQFHKARSDDPFGRDAKAAAEKRRLEFERRREAEETAKRRQDDYHTHLTAARNFLTLHKPDDALVEFRSAEKLFRTDAVLDGIRQAQTQSDHRRKLEEAETRRRSDELAKHDRLRTLLADGDAALAAGRGKEARDAYVAAAALFPDNVQAIAGISKADRAIEDARRRGD